MKSWLPPLRSHDDARRLRAPSREQRAQRMGVQRVACHGAVHPSTPRAGFARTGSGSPGAARCAWRPWCREDSRVDRPRGGRRASLSRSLSARWPHGVDHRRESQHRCGDQPRLRRGGRQPGRERARSRGARRVRASVRERFGVQVTAIAADLGQPAERARLIAETERRVGGVDILVNNATAGGRPDTGLATTPRCGATPSS